MTKTKNRSEGVVVQWVQDGGELAESTVTSVFEFLRTTQRELEERFGATIDLVESWQQSGFKLARDANGRCGKLTLEAMDGGEQGLVALVQRIREGTEEAAEFVFKPLSKRAEHRKEGSASVQAA